MSLLESLGIDDQELKTVNADQIEKEVAAGGCVPPGKYHAMLVGTAPHKAKSSDSSGQLFEFEILAGPFKGSKIEEVLWRSDKAKGKNRSIIFANRLGLTVKDSSGEGYVAAPGITGWCDLIGKQCIIDVIIEESDMTDKITGKPTGKKWRQNKLEFDGVYKVDDPRVKEVERAGGVPVPSKDGSSTPAPKVDDYAALGV